MLVKILSLVLSVIILICLCGCAITENGYSLYAFCERMNKCNSEYNLTPTGYIINESDKTMTKFFRLSQKEIMLQFVYDAKNQLTSLHIVFDNSERNNTEEEKFIKNCIYSFIHNTSITDSILTEIDFENTISKSDMNTKNAKIDNIEMLIDVTDLGTVITVVQSIP